MIAGQVASPKLINLMYSGVERHYHVITNTTVSFLKRYCVKRVAKRAQVMSHASAIRCVATVSRVLRQHSPTYESPATNVTYTLGAARVSKRTIRAQRRENQCVNEGDFARLVDCL